MPFGGDTKPNSQPTQHPNMKDRNLLSDNRKNFNLEVSISGFLSMFSSPLHLHSCSKQASSMSIRAVEAIESVLVSHV